MAASKRLTKAALTLLKPSISGARSLSFSPLLADSRAKQLPLVDNNVVPFNFSTVALSRHFCGGYSSPPMEWEGITSLLWRAVRESCEVVETEDFMKALMEEKHGLAGRIFSEAGLDNTSILQAIDDFISKKQPKGACDSYYYKVGEHLNSLLENAIKHRNDMVDESVSVEHFILAFHLDRRFGQQLFTNFGISEKDLRDAIDAVRGSLSRELNGHWGIEKALMNLIRTSKEEIDVLNGAELKYGTLIALRTQLEHAWENLGVTVSKWTRTHLEVGQNVTVISLANPILRPRLSDSNRPIASFMFMGSTGVGKKTLADYLFKTEKILPDFLSKTLVNKDMSEYIENQAFPRLVVALGDREKDEVVAQLTEFVRQHRPYCVILFEEIEKAHQDVLSILLQILDNGRIADCQGKTVCFKNTVIIMTYRIGSHLLKDSLSSLEEDAPIASEMIYDIMKKHVVDLSRQPFRPEFMNFIDEYIVFKQLEAGNLAEVKMMDWKERLKHDDNIELHYCEEAIDVVGRLVYDPKDVMKDFEEDLDGVLCAVAELRFPRTFHDEEYCDDDCDVFDVVKVDVDSELGLGRIRCKRLPTHHQVYLGTDETRILNFRYD